MASLYFFFLLQQAGGLRYDRQLFLMDLERVHFDALPGFYQSLLDAWKGFGVHRSAEAYNCLMFLQEPLFYNHFLPGIPQSKALINKFIQGRVNKVCDLRDSSGSRWRSAGSLVTSLGCRSIRLVDQIVRIVFRKFGLLNIGWKVPVLWRIFGWLFSKLRCSPHFS